MVLTIENARAVVDYQGTDDLEYAATSAPEATVPDAVLEALKTRGYIVHRE